MAVVGLSKPRPVRLAASGAIEWVGARWEVGWLLVLIGIAIAAHAWNMFNFPYYEDDEGTYVSQAWAILGGRLAPYTYWYDHPPLGWIQLGLLSMLTGGFNALGNSVATGRVFMLLYDIGSVGLVYYVARGSGRSVAAASVAVLAFSFSAYGLYLHRRVLLDNIAAFWLILSIALLIAPRLSLTRVWLSAAALGVAILSKEIAIVAVPGIVLLVVRLVDRSHRPIAVIGWLGLVAAIASTWVLFAALKGELFPVGSVLGGTRDHVSLIGTLVSQAGRDSDGGILQVDSGFWRSAGTWIWQDPVLVVAGTIGSLLALVRVRSHPAPAAIGLVVLSIWLFLGRGGITIGFYLVPALPLLAIGVAWLVDQGLALVRRIRPKEIGKPAVALLLGLFLVGTLSGYQDSTLGYRSNPLQLWTGQPSSGARSAVEWVRATLPTKAGIVTDMYAWLDLHAPPPTARAFDVAHYYWKVDLDPEIRSGVFSETWKTIQYLIVTGQMKADASADRLPLVKAALAHATELRTFDTGGWPVTVERVDLPQSWPASDDELLRALWGSTGTFGDASWWQRSSSTRSADLAGLTLLAAVYMDDRAVFDTVWTWANSNLRSPDGRVAARTVQRANRGPVALAGPGTDTDVAVALAFAADRWKVPSYRVAARKLVDAIWTHETVAVKGGRVVAPIRPADRSRDPVRVDSSAIAPYAYRIFSSIDPGHPWGDVVEGSYRLLAGIQAQKPTGGRLGLVPHWALIDPRSGRVRVAPAGATENLFDAAAGQVGWRFGLDWLWNRDERARQVLVGLSMPQRELSARGWLARGYRLNGKPLDGRGDIAQYVTALAPMLFRGNVEQASSAFTKFVLAPVVGANSDAVDTTSRAWAWFGTAFMDGALVDLTGSARQVDWSAAAGLGP